MTLRQNFALTTFTTLSALFVLIQAQAPADASKPVSTTTKTVSAPTTVGQKMRRLDFRLEGASCATCLLKIRSVLRATKGVSRCELALRKPYGGVVIYNAAQIDIKKITELATKADPRSSVSVKDVLDEPIAKEPLMLIPKHNSLLQKS